MLVPRLKEDKPKNYDDDEWDLTDHVYKCELDLETMVWTSTETVKDEKVCGCSLKLFDADCEQSKGGGSGSLARLSARVTK